MYLIDTNVWLHRLLEHDHSEEVAEFLESVDPRQLLITDFTLHSLGVILHRLGRVEVLVDFVQDLLIDGAVEVVSVAPEQMIDLVGCMREERLDFDDGYQYLAARERGATLVSYDKDFATTKRASKTPEQILLEIRSME